MKHTNLGASPLTLRGSGRSSARNKWVYKTSPLWYYIRFGNRKRDPGTSIFRTCHCFDSVKIFDCVILVTAKRVGSLISTASAGKVRKVSIGRYLS